MSRVYVPVHVYTDADSTYSPIVLLFVGIVLIVLDLIYTVNFVVRVLPRIKARYRGIASTGVVVFIGTRYIQGMMYTYPRISFMTHFGSTFEYDETVRSRWKVGEWVEVFYDPNRPEIATVRTKSECVKQIIGSAIFLVVTFLFGLGSIVLSALGPA